MSYTKKEVVSLLCDVRDRLSSIGKHACPGADCAICDSSRNIEEIDIAIQKVQAKATGWTE